MKKVILLLLSSFLLSGGGRALEADFGKGVSPHEVFANAPDLSVEDGKIRLPENLTSHPIPVEEGRKYLLQIMAEVAGPFVVEENERSHIIILRDPLYRRTAAYSVAFYDAADQEISALGRDRIAGFILTRQPGLYTNVFYAPPEAATMRVRFKANGRDARLASIRLVEETAEGTINPNPDFRYGELSYCGWRPQRDGRLYTRPDGKVVFNTGYLGGSSMFPLAGGKTYRFFARGSGSALNAIYYDHDGKQLVQRFLLRPAPQGVSVEATPPPGTAYCRITVNGVAFLEEFAVKAQ